MKIVEPSVTLVHCTPDPERVIEKMGRICYQSSHKTRTCGACGGTGGFVAGEEAIASGFHVGEDVPCPACGGAGTDVESARDFIRMILKRGHESVIEHASAGFMIVTDRGITHEIVRHRLASYCLVGNTELIAFCGKARRSPKRWTIAQLFKWQSENSRKGRLKLIRLRSVDAHGRLIPGQIARITDSGVQAVLRVKTVSGREICATAAHRFLTPLGWRPLGVLRVGDRLTANGLPAWANPEWIMQKYITEKLTRPEVAALAGVSDSLIGRVIRRFGIHKPLVLRKNRRGGGGRIGMHSKDGLIRIAASKKGARNPQWRGAAVSLSGGRQRACKVYQPDVCWGCGCRERRRLERHHFDENPVNNAPENIFFLCAGCHKSFHLGAAVRTVFSDQIVSIESAGEQQTYDIEMACEPRNFVANGLVVHNSQESTRYCNYSKDGFGGEITVVEPPGLSEWRCSWKGACEDAEELYLALMEPSDPDVDTGDAVSPQIARSVLPNSLKSEIGMTTNFREWRHFLRLRTSPAAHPQMRQIAEMIRAELLKISRVCFEDIP